MAKRIKFVTRATAATTLRRSGKCILMGDGPMPAALRDIVSNQAVLEAQHAPSIGSRVELHHPEGGVLIGNVVDVMRSGVRVAFNMGDRATRFALAMIKP